MHDFRLSSCQADNQLAGMLIAYANFGLSRRIASQICNNRLYFIHLHITMVKSRAEGRLVAPKYDVTNIKLQLFILKASFQLKFLRKFCVFSKIGNTFLK